VQYRTKKGEHMQLTTTFRLLRKSGACEGSYRKLRKSLKGVKDTEPINLITILDTLNIEDALWALRATQQNCDKVARLIAADFAEEVLPIWNKHYPSDNRPSEAIKAARDFANGLITEEQRAAAGAAAWAAGAAAWAAGAAAGAAAWAAGAAAGAAGAAAWDAAGAAAWAAGAAAGAAAGEKNASIFRKHLQD
jgi:hypothetical protein